MTRLAKLSFLLLDAVVFVASVSLAFWLRFDGAIPGRFLRALLWAIPLVVLIKGSVFVAFRLYRRSWRHARRPCRSPSLTRARLAWA